MPKNLLSLQQAVWHLTQIFLPLAIGIFSLPKFAASLVLNLNLEINQNFLNIGVFLNRRMPAKKRFLLAILLIFLLVPIIRADTDAIDYLTAQPGPSSLIRELLAESIERATTTCAARGSVIVNLVKRQYRYNEKIDADVTLINNSTIPTDITYAIRLSKGDIIALEQVRLKSTPPGADKIKIGLLGKTTRFSVPPNIELGRWKLEVIVSMDNCILMGYDYLDVVSCEDN